MKLIWLKTLLPEQFTNASITKKVYEINFRQKQFDRRNFRRKFFKA